MGILTGTDKPPATAIVDKGYWGVEIKGMRILRSDQKRGITEAPKAMIKGRSAIEPTIGHMKMVGRLGGNPLKGALGDALHAVMCGAGHNLRLILAALPLYCARLGLLMQVSLQHCSPHPVTAVQYATENEIVQDGLPAHFPPCQAKQRGRSHVFRHAQPRVEYARDARGAQVH